MSWPPPPSRGGRGSSDLDATSGSSRGRSPPLVAPSWGGRDTDLDDETSISPRRLRPYSPGPDRTPASMPAPQPSFQASMSDASVVQLGLRPTPSVSLTHHLEESGSDSEVELDSPPRLTILELPEDEPGTPTSPRGGPPPSIDAEHAVLSTFAEEWHSSDAEDDPCFKSLVDNFIIAAKDVCESSEDSIDKKACSRRQADEFAESALKYYNNDKNNKVKYDLIRATKSCGIFDVERCYGHVNFIAKGNQPDSKEELFFAEIQLDTDVPTCVLSLEGMKKVGGLRESKYDTYHGMGIYIDAQHCYACRSGLKHPGNGALYESRHVAGSGFYHL